MGCAWAARPTYYIPTVCDSIKYLVNIPKYVVNVSQDVLDLQGEEPRCGRKHRPRAVCVRWSNKASELHSSTVEYVHWKALFGLLIRTSTILVSSGCNDLWVKLSASHSLY